MGDEGLAEARASEIRDWYEGYVFKCRLFTEKLDRHLVRAVQRAGLMDARVESRAKSVDSLVGKATKIDGTGAFKYADPRREITDMVGARVMVPLSTDVPPVAHVIREAFAVEEELDRGEEDGHIDIPGYRSVHFVVRLKPEDARDPDLQPFADMPVEIQVRTILQHAWAMLQHDVMYKAERPPTPTVRRRLVALAGLLELADREFIQVRNVHADVRDVVPTQTEHPGDNLSATSLRQYAETIFAEEDGAAHEWFVELRSVTDSLGLRTVEELNELLGSWRDRAGEVKAVARRRQPWLSTALLMDQLLRLAANESYFDARPPTEEDGYQAEDIAGARRAFLEETARFAAEVDSE